jgi:hypothetical protein
MLYNELKQMNIGTDPPCFGRINRQVVDGMYLIRILLQEISVGMVIAVRNIVKRHIVVIKQLLIQFTDFWIIIRAIIATIYTIKGGN